MYELLDRTSFNTVWLSYLPSAWFHANVLCHDFVIHHTSFSSSSVLRSSSQVAGLSPVFVFPFFFLECCWKLYLSCNFAGLGHLAFHFSPFIVWTTQMISYGVLYRWTCVYNLFPHISDSLLLAVFFYYSDRKNTWCWAHQRRQQQQQQQHSLFSQASWGRLEMKPERNKFKVQAHW